MEELQNIIYSLKDYLKLILEQWWFVIPMGVFLVVAARYFEKVAIAVFGFLLGTNAVFPLLADKIEPFGKWALQNPTNQMIAIAVIGVLTAVGMYILYASVMFLVGFFTGGILTYYIVNMIVVGFELMDKFPQFVQDNWQVIHVVVAGLIGVIGGFVALKKSTQVVTVLSVIVGAGILSITSVGWIIYFQTKDWNKVFNTMSQSWAVILLIAVFMFLLILGLYLNFRKKRVSVKTKEP